jgi:hypothetical protein
MSTQKPQWTLAGEYFESCNCAILCPCLLLGGRPTEGHCDVVLAFHIEKGKYGNVDLSGLNAVQALTTPGVMSAGGGTLAVYVDDRATPEQRAALEEIFTGAAGGPPSLFGPMVAKLLPIRSAPISFAADGKKRTVSIAKVTAVTVEAITGAGRQVVWMENVGHPYSTRLAVARGSSSQFRDHQLSFDNSGRNGHFSHIEWSNG